MINVTLSMMSAFEPKVLEQAMNRLLVDFEAIFWIFYFCIQYSYCGYCLFCSWFCLDFSVLGAFRRFRLEVTQCFWLAVLLGVTCRQILSYSAITCLGDTETRAEYNDSGWVRTATFANLGHKPHRQARPLGSQEEERLASSYSVQANSIKFDQSENSSCNCFYLIGWFQIKWLRAFCT